MVSQSYLSEPKQCVTYNDTQTAIKIIRCGMPQRSIMGPLLFLCILVTLRVFVNKPCLSCLPMICLFINGDDLLGMAQILNTDLENISHCFKVNNLSRNVG